MNLHINGEETTFDVEPGGAPFTLAALIESLNMKPDRVAVELNREIVPRNLWPQTPLKEGDRLEIVHFVGGGSRGSFSSLRKCRREQRSGRARLQSCRRSRNGFRL
jgi:thiamine biosynthesis protein ThiS